MRSLVGMSEYPFRYRSHPAEARKSRFWIKLMLVSGILEGTIPAIP